MSLLVPREAELYRTGPPGDHKNGAFYFRDGLFVICSDGAGWEHVSVSRKSKLPSYEDMCRVKDMFWGEEDCVMQLMVPKSEHVNYHPYCLHMWRPLEVEIPRPPMILVGPKEKEAG